jgi:hypothetical protein
VSRPVLCFVGAFSVCAALSAGRAYASYRSYAASTCQAKNGSVAYFSSGALENTTTSSGIYYCPVLQDPSYLDLTGTVTVSVNVFANSCTATNDAQVRTCVIDYANGTNLCGSYVGNAGGAATLSPLTSTSWGELTGMYADQDGFYLEVLFGSYCTGAGSPNTLYSYFFVGST